MVPDPTDAKEEDDGWTTVSNSRRRPKKRPKSSAQSLIRTRAAAVRDATEKTSRVATEKASKDATETARRDSAEMVARELDTTVEESVAVEYEYLQRFANSVAELSEARAKLEPFLKLLPELLKAL